MIHALGYLILSAAVTLPFPAPKRILINDDTKADWGQVSQVSSGGSELTITTQSGPLHLAVAPDAPVVDANGRKIGTAAELRPGQDVRVYYELLGSTLDDGGTIREIDLR